MPDEQKTVLRNSFENVVSLGVSYAELAQAVGIIEDYVSDHKIGYAQPVAPAGVLGNPIPLIETLDYIRQGFNASAVQLYEFAQEISAKAEELGFDPQDLFSDLLP